MCCYSDNLATVVNCTVWYIFPTIIRSLYFFIVYEYVIYKKARIEFYNNLTT